MQHTITTSADGSSTLQLTQFGEAYHSTNGAYTEAMHIYISCGLEHLYATTSSEHITIFDVGIGTALNCILTWAWQQQLRQKGLPYPKIHYWGIEKYPIPLSETKKLNYPTIIAQHTGLLPDNLAEVFHFMHKCPWEEDVTVPRYLTVSHSGNKYTSESAPTTELCHLWNNSIPGCAATEENDFILHKRCADIAEAGAEFYRRVCRPGAEETLFSTEANTAPAVVFYDTFSPATQPELWDEAIFRNIAAGCPAGSILVTYCSKGTVKQALRNAGFTLERLVGPPGKRHILRGSLR